MVEKPYAKFLGDQTLEPIIAMTFDESAKILYICNSNLLI